jgi:hypothetical protein
MKTRSILINGGTGLEIKIGDPVVTFRGENAVLIDIIPPHKPSSSGRVILKIRGHEQEFYPGVIDAYILCPLRGT